jgi:CRP-like cAMP-binding protein
VAKDRATTNKLIEIVQNHFLFAHLAPAELEAIVEVMTPVDCEAGDAIIRQGDKGDAFYLVTDGLFDIHVDGVGKVAGDLGCGKSFGELALLYNAPRNASVVASVPAKAWAIDRATFRAAMAVRSRETQAEVCAQISGAPLLKHLTKSQLTKVADAIKYQTFAAGDIIINKGEVGNAFYLIKKGSVLCTDIGTSSAAIADVPLDAGTYFGERSLLRDEPRAATIVATTDVEVMVLDRRAFQNLLGPLEEVMNFNHFMRMLRSVPALQDLEDAKLEDVIEECDKIVCGAAGEVVARMTDPPEDMYLVVAGTVALQPPVGAALKTVSEGEHFSGATLGGFGRSSVDAVAAENTTVWRVSARVIASAVSAAAGASGDAAAAGGAAKKKREVCTIKLDELEQLATLGMGTFGRVRLCKHAATDTVYALKMMQKALVVRRFASEQRGGRTRAPRLVLACLPAPRAPRAPRSTLPFADSPVSLLLPTNQRASPTKTNRWSTGKRRRWCRRKKFSWRWNTPLSSACTRRTRMRRSCTCCSKLCPVANSSGSKASSRTLASSRTGRASTRRASRTRWRTCTT